MVGLCSFQLVENLWSADMRRPSVSWLGLSVRISRRGVEGEYSEVLAVEPGFLDADDGAGGDGRFVAEVLGLLLPVHAQAALGAVGDNAGLPAHEQGAGSIDVAAGAVVGEADRGCVAVQHDVVDHAKATLE